MKSKIEIALVDDDQLVVSLLSSYFQSQEMVEVLFTSLNGKELLHQLSIQKKLPQVIILDLRMKEMDGLEALNILKKDYPAIKVIILSSHYKDESIGFMLKSGVDAFQPKGIRPEELLKIIVEVQEKGHYFSDKQMDVIRTQLPAKSNKEEYPDELTKREVEILELICKQKTAKEIGEILFVTQRTVEGHKNNILMKTGVKNTAGLVIYSVKHKLIDPTLLIE